VYKFTKYHSLENDFIIFVEQKIGHRLGPLAKKICDRKKGVGADGIISIKLDEVPEIFVTNADGSDGELCLNGARCAAHLLYTKQNFPNKFQIRMGKKIISHTIEKNKIVQRIEMGRYIGEKTLKIDSQDFCGHIVDVGNPHFIVAKQQTSSWLAEHGKKIESHHEFPNKTNVEFFWAREKNSFNVIVFERGVGLTQACSSGASAIITYLHTQRNLQPTKNFALCMPGGTLECEVTNKNEILIGASAEPVFEGLLDVHRTVRQQSHRAGKLYML